MRMCGVGLSGFDRCADGVVICEMDGDLVGAELEILRGGGEWGISTSILVEQKGG